MSDGGRLTKVDTGRLAERCMGKRFVLTLVVFLVSVPFVTSSAPANVGVGLGLAGVGVYATVEAAVRRVAARFSL